MAPQETNTRWTHPSVRALAGQRDPIDAIVDRARAVVAEALDAGWSGPPFDPMTLADHLGLHLRALEDVPDARLVMEASKRAVIEFNPNRPSARVRYSIAHEIGHYLFPDWSEAVRSRLARHEIEEPEERQVELLCNLAAAEFLMPVGSFPELETDPPDIDHLMRRRVEFQVSSEALLLRIARLSTDPMTIFSAVRIDADEAGRYELEYAIAPNGIAARIPKGLILPERSVVRECRAIGYTARGDEVWGTGGKQHVEAVGVPGYPGSRYPRVVGLVLPLAPHSVQSRLNEVTGSALLPQGTGVRVITHVANDKARTWGGGGFAARLGHKWPCVHHDFREWIQHVPPAARLGAVRFCEAEPGVFVATMVAQHGYGPSSVSRLRYGALDRCLKEVARRTGSINASVHMPRIGTGLAGGNWWLVREMIENHLAHEGIDVTVYTLPQEPSSRGSGKSQP